MTSRHAISNIVANFADKRVGGATGICIAERGIEKLLRNFLNMLQVMETNVDSTVIGTSACLAFRLSCVEPVDVSSMADDTEEMVLIRRKGYKVVVDPSVVAIEEVPKEFRKRRLQKDRRAQGIIRVLLQNRMMLFNPRFGAYGFLVLPIELFLLALSPFILIAAGIVLGILAYMAEPLLALTLIILLVVAFVYRSNVIAATIDTALSGLIGTLMNLAKKDNSRWAKVRQ